MKKQILFMAFVMSLFVTPTHADAVYNCRGLNSCSSNNGSNGCTLGLKFTQCDGSNGSLDTACPIMGCEEFCDCSCDGTGGTVSYYDCYSNYVIIGYYCSGCN